jgi:hypothetical protein
MGAVAAGVGAAASLATAGAAIANSGGGPQISGGGGGGQPFLYQPQGQPQQDQNYQNLLALMMQYGNGLPGQLIPQYQAASNAITNNPYASLAMQGANNAAALAPGVAGMQLGGAGSLYGAGNQILGQAFDPQGALYNRTQQQLMDQINAANAASGLAGPAAAGVAQQGLTNFNIDWQNNLLQRMLAGERGAGQAFTGASGLGQEGIGTLQSGSNIPYATYLGQQQDILGGLNALPQGVQTAFALPQQTLGDIARYLGLGQSAGVDALAAQNQAFNQSLQAGQGITGALTALGNNKALQSSLSSLFSPQQTPISAFYPGGQYYDPSVLNSDPYATYGFAY